MLQIYNLVGQTIQFNKVFISKYANMYVPTYVHIITLIKTMVWKETFMLEIPTNTSLWLSCFGVYWLNDRKVSNV